MNLRVNHLRSFRFLPFLSALALAFFAPRAHAEWTAVNSPTTENLWGLCYGADQFVAVGTAGTVLTSADGTTWTARPSGTAEWLTAVAYSAEQHLYVAVGDHGTILTSPDAVTWTPRTSATTTTQRLNNVAYAAGRWLAVGEAGTVATSTDALTWTVTTLPLDTWLRGLCYGPDSFLIGAGDGTLCSTEDGTHFRYLGKNPFNASVEALFCQSGITFAAGSNRTVQFSSDRINWEAKSSSGDPLSFRGLARDALAVVAVGQSGSLFGADYGGRYLGPPSRRTLGTANLNAIVYGPLAGVIVGDHGTIYSLANPTPASPAFGETPAISAPPYLGGTVTLTVDHFGPPPFTYQWSHSGQPIPGASTEALNLRQLSASDVGTYTLTVTNPFGSASKDLNLPAPALPPSAAVDGHFLAPFISASSASFIPLPDGRWLVAPSDSDRLIRLNLDGSWDLSFQAAATGDVSVLSDRKLLVQSPYPDRPSVTQLNADGSLDATFAASAAPGYVTPLADGRLVRIVIGNQITISRLDEHGVVDPSFASSPIPLPPPPSYDSYSRYWPVAALDESGRLYVAASIPPSRMVSAVSFLFRLKKDGTLDDAFTPVTHSDCIASLKVIHGKLCYFTGSDGYSSISRSYSFARFNEDGTIDTDFPRFSFSSMFMPENPRGAIPVGTFDADGGLILTTDNPVSRGLVRYDSHGVRDPSFSARLDTSITTISSLTLAPDGSLLAAGTFTSLNGHPTAGLARIVPTTNAYATRLSNLSILTTAGSGDATLIAGFIVGGTTGTRSVLLRGVGPGLARVDVNPASVLPDPFLKVHRDSTLIATNDDWDSALAPTATALGAFPLLPGSRDAALLATLAPGNHSVHLAAAHGTAAGLALVEVYDADPAPTSSDQPRLRNLSGRAQVGGSTNTLAAGFVIAGHATKRILLRAVGPQLVSLGVASALPNPKLTLYQAGSSTPLAVNDDWSAPDADTFAAVGAFALAPGSADSALVVDLPPGVYSAVVSSADGRAGVALVEVYEVP